VLDDPLGEFLLCLVGRVLYQDPAQQGAAAGDGEPDREIELRAERAVIYRLSS